MSRDTAYAIQPVDHACSSIRWNCRQYITVKYLKDICMFYAGRDIRISNQFLNTRALHFAQPQAYYQASVTITLGRRV